MTVATQGIDAARVDEWFAANVAGAQPPLYFTLIAGGHSNLTYGVVDRAGRKFVLRRPPLGHVLPTAHDMSREHRVLAALAGTDVPVPQVLGLCTDPEVNGAPFYVMDYVDGEVLRDTATASAAFSESDRYQLGLALADTLAAIHQIEPADVGLAELGRPEGYIARQLKRWRAQLDDSRTRPLEQLDEIHEELSTRIPDQIGSGIVHGDFRLDNCIVGGDARVRAVLDWELCTLGDSMADVGMLMVYWAAPDDPLTPLANPPTLAPGFPSRAQMLDRYAATRGIDLPDVAFYVAFSYWRLACITEGVYARYLHGDMGDRQEEAVHFEQRVIDLGRAAADALQRA